MVLNQNISKFRLNNFCCLINLTNCNSRKPKRANFRHILFMTVQHKFYVVHQLKWLMTENCTHKVSYWVKSKKLFLTKTFKAEVVWITPYHLHEHTISQDILKMILIPLLQVICSVVVLVCANPEGKALIVFYYRLESFVFQFFFKFSGGFISTGY